MDNLKDNYLKEKDLLNDDLYNVLDSTNRNYSIYNGKEKTILNNDNIINYLLIKND